MPHALSAVVPSPPLDSKNEKKVSFVKKQDKPKKSLGELSEPLNYRFMSRISPLLFLVEKCQLEL